MGGGPDAPQVAIVDQTLGRSTHEQIVSALELKPARHQEGVNEYWRSDTAFPATPSPRVVDCTL